MTIDNNTIRDRIRGCIVGGAAGDALGYPVEFDRFREIKKDYGDAGIIAAVNHDGDSDSTGAITGNILGALHGYDAIDSKWTRLLEMEGLQLKMADRIADRANK